MLACWCEISAGDNMKRLLLLVEPEKSLFVSHTPTPTATHTHTSHTPPFNFTVYKQLIVALQRRGCYLATKQNRKGLCLNRFLNLPCSPGVLHRGVCCQTYLLQEVLIQTKVAIVFGLNKFVASTERDDVIVNKQLKLDSTSHTADGSC